MYMPSWRWRSMGHSSQRKNFIQAFAGNSLWRKRCSASLNCQQYFLVSYGYVTSIRTKYTCNIHSIYTVYPIEIFCICSLNSFDIHAITWYMYNTCDAYNQKILEIYLAYTRYIQINSIESFCIYSLNLFDIHAITWYMHGICKAYTYNILEIYLVYTMYIQLNFSVYTV